VGTASLPRASAAKIREGGGASGPRPENFEKIPFRRRSDAPRDRFFDGDRSLGAIDAEPVSAADGGQGQQAPSRTANVSARLPLSPTPYIPRRFCAARPTAARGMQSCVDPHTEGQRRRRALSARPHPKAAKVAGRAPSPSP